MRLRGRPGPARLIRSLALTGIWLAVVLTASVWTFTLTAQVPARAALARASAELGALDAHLADAQWVLAPLDPLARPETLGAVRSLRSLARAAGETPLAERLFGRQALATAEALTADWERGLTTRPPLPALAQARREVAVWRVRIEATRRRLTLGVWAVNIGTLLLAAWFAAGQVALYRAAVRQLGE